MPYCYFQFTLPLSIKHMFQLAEYTIFHRLRRRKVGSTFHFLYFLSFRCSQTLRHIYRNIYQQISYTVTVNRWQTFPSQSQHFARLSSGFYLDFRLTVYRRDFNSHHVIIQDAVLPLSRSTDHRLPLHAERHFLFRSLKAAFLQLHPPEYSM